MKWLYGHKTAHNHLITPSYLKVKFSWTPVSSDLKSIYTQCFNLPHPDILLAKISFRAWVHYVQMFQLSQFKLECSNCLVRWRTAPVALVFKIISICKLFKGSKMQNVIYKQNGYNNSLLIKLIGSYQAKRNFSAGFRERNFPTCIDELFLSQLDHGFIPCHLMIYQTTVSVEI